MWVDDKLKEGVKVPELGKIKKVSTTNTAYLTYTMSQALGIPADYFNTKKKRVTNLAAGTKTTIQTLAGVDVIEVPEKITVTYVQVFGTGKYERTGEAFENVVRPNWFSEDVWSNKNITKAVYEPLLGTRAITDDNSMGQKQQNELLKRRRSDQVKTMTAADGKTVIGAVESVDGVYFVPVAEGSVEETIDGLSLVYGMIKENGGNIHEFIREFTHRPIASIIDILGSQNLEFDDNGKVKDPDSMIEGFHSRAFGDYNTDVQLPEKEGSSTKAGAKALHALIDFSMASPDVRAKGIAGLERPGLIGRDEQRSGIRPELDPRGRARGRVRAYVEELQLSRGLLGS